MCTGPTERSNTYVAVSYSVCQAKKPNFSMADKRFEEWSATNQQSAINNGANIYVVRGG